MMSDLNIPWLSLSGDDTDVADDLDDMEIGSADDNNAGDPGSSPRTVAKRKRTLSLASPPKVCFSYLHLLCCILRWHRTMVAQGHLNG
jgi:hypothetical protein